jgi:hypothetical protein
MRYLRKELVPHAVHQAGLPPPPPPTIEVSHYLKDGIFVPALFFEPHLLAFVHPGASDPAENHGISKWSSLIIFLCATAFCLVTYFAPHAVARSLKYAAVSLTHLAFSTAAFYGPVEVYSVLAAAFVTTACLEAGWNCGWAMAAMSALVAPIDPAIALLLAASCKALVDAEVLQEETTAWSYGQWRRWGTVGVAVTTAIYGRVQYTASEKQHAAVSGIACTAAAVLGAGALRFRNRRERSGSDPRSRRWEPSAWGIGTVVFCLGIARGAMLPHAFATELIANGFPPQVTGLVGLIAVIVEFGVLSLQSACFFDSGHATLLAIGVLLTGVHLQVICAVSAANWLFVLPISAVLAGVSAAFVALSIPCIAASYGGPLAQGVLQSLEFLGTAVAVEVWPQVSKWAGETFAYQLSADLLVVVGVVMIFADRLGLKKLLSSPASA